MNSNKFKLDGRFEELRQRRSNALEMREHARLRAMHGPRLAAIISMATERTVSVEDFDETVGASPDLAWPKDLKAAPGLVAAYVNKRKAAKLLACFQDRLGSISGKI